MNVSSLLSLLCLGFSVASCGGTDKLPDVTPAAATVKLTSSNRFEPANVTVKVGQTIEWQWQGGRHNVVSGGGCASDGKFTSGDVVAEGTYRFTFKEPGSFDYFCTPHCAIGMVGKVTVTP